MAATADRAVSCAAIGAGLAEVAVGALLPLPVPKAALALAVAIAIREAAAALLHVATIPEIFLSAAPLPRATDQLGAAHAYSSMREQRPHYYCRSELEFHSKHGYKLVAATEA